MDNFISEYDERQLQQMYRHLIMFENMTIDLNSLVGSLEFLLHAMEKVTIDYEEKFLNEISVLESINAEPPNMNKKKVDKLIYNAVINLKNLIEDELIKTQKQ